MKPVPFALLTLVLAVPAAQARELTGAALLSEISGKSFSCQQGNIPLTWTISQIAPDAVTVPYTAVVHGKTVEADYSITPEGRLSSSGYGDTRTVDIADDGTLTVTRADGRVMTCRNPG